MIERKKALEIVLAHSKKLAVVRRHVRESLGHTLARAVKTPIDFPPFDKSAMDGYAIAEGGVGSAFTVIGEVQAGGVFTKKVKAGEAVKIMTGAMLPPGAARVVMKEHVDILADGKIRISLEDEKKNISRRGEDITKGSVLYPKGCVIDAVGLANIAAAGISQVNVYRRPRAGLLVTGSELLAPGEKYRQGMIYNSNGPLISSLLSICGITDIVEKKVSDSPSKLTSALKKLLATCDVIFITGGISVGDYDFVSLALDSSRCETHFSKVAIQPGRPFTFATRGRKTVFAFPGNPTSLFATYFLFALPALMKMDGVDFEHRRIKCVIKGAYERRIALREQFVPVRFVENNIVRTVPLHGSGDLYALSRADGLMIVPIGTSKLNDGEEVCVLPLMDVDAMYHRVGMRQSVA